MWVQGEQQALSMGPNGAAGWLVRKATAPGCVPHVLKQPPYVSRVRKHIGITSPYITY